MKTGIGRLIGSGLVVFLLLLGVASAADQITIRFWGGWTGPDKFGMEKIVSNFMEENPDVKVEFFTAPWTEVFTKFSTTFGTPAGPDLLAMHVSDIAQFASRGMLMRVEEIAKQNNLLAEDFPPMVWQGQFYENKQYGIPLDYHPLAVYKNVAMFRSVGVDPGVAFDSRETFLDVLQKLTQPEKQQYALAIGINHPHTMRYWYGWLFQQEGGQFLNEEQNRAAFNSEQGVAALQFIYDLLYTYKVAPLHESDIDKDFLTGRVAMVIEGPWWIPGVREQENLEVLLAPFPKVFDKPAVWAGSHTLTLPKQANQQRIAAAVKLLSYVVNHSVEWGNAGQIPASLRVIQSEAYKSLPDYKHFKVFIDQADYIHFEPLIVQNASFGSDNQMSPVLNAIFSVLLGEKSAKEALDQAAEEVNALFME
ncbi:MAG: ABC transporter substrate-binding protein [Candidatus Caldatribacterium sp.]|nr:ABC transporter substrate-binding protein [Candidatus Caldatribacterium sp.]